MGTQDRFAWKLTAAIAMVSAVAVLLVSGGASAQGQNQPANTPSTRPAQRQEREREHERGGPQGLNLEGSMKAMNRAFKQLKAQVQDKSKNESSVALVMQMEQATVSAKAQPPRLPRDSQQQRTEKQSDFHSALINLLRQELDLEEHLLASDNAKAADDLSTMEDIMKQGHQEFHVKLHERD